jgi:hypothetical protein
MSQGFATETRAMAFRLAHIRSPPTATHAQKFIVATSHRLEQMTPL